ncbi:MAG: ABC transporter ATP-binding protein [Cyclobacteriaceae bacterium]|nr:ABC transporter ATP-binding protein [Cyclobacteriaceae bacterium]
MIQLLNLYKNFGKTRVLEDVNVLLKEGRITAVLGPNGSGKTTLIKTILGLVKADKGQVKVSDLVINGCWEYRKDIDYLSQIARFPDNLKVVELINMIKDFRPQETRENYLIDLFELRPSLGKKLGELSGGTRQKVNIVVTLMFDSKYLILDEPTVGLDPVALLRLKDFIRDERKRGKTILITTHIINLVNELAEDIIFLLEGKVYFQGTIEEMIKLGKSDDLERVIAEILTNGKEG